MIKVQIERDADNNIRAFTLDGHAEAGPYGKDIVCAGVSAVSFGAIHAVQKLCDVELQLDVADSGFLRCVVPCHLNDETKVKVQLLFEGMVISLRAIEEGYRKYIRIIDRVGGGRNA